MPSVSSIGRPRPIGTDADIVVFHSAEDFDPSLTGGRTYRGSHMIRDPRDMIVSGYEYHRTTEESWARRPDRRFGGMSYQEYLLSLDEHEGLHAEIDFQVNGPVAAMAAWDYGRPEFLELRYEDVVADESEAFERLFRWYGFSDKAVGAGVEAAESLSLHRGGARPTHVRWGWPGEWRERLAPDHVARFKEMTGDLMIRLGYEQDPDW